MSLTDFLPKDVSLTIAMALCAIAFGVTMTFIYGEDPMTGVITLVCVFIALPLLGGLKVEDALAGRSDRARRDVVDVGKVAVTERPAVMMRTQLPVPVQSPLQPLNTEPVAGAAVSVTDVPPL